MDVILGRLEPRQLRVHCSDALQQELTKAFELLALTLAASKRAEEVQLASRKLEVYEFLDDSALLQRLEQIDSLRLQLSISIDRIVSSAKGKLPPDLARSVKHEASLASGLQSILELSDATTISPLAAATALPTTAPVIDLSAAEGDDESPSIAVASTRKRKLSVSLPDEQLQPLTATAAKKFVPTFTCVSPTSRLGKAIQTAFDGSLAVKKRKASDRIQGLATLAAMTSVVVNRLDGADAASVREAMDALAYLFATEVSILMKAKPMVKRPVALKKLKAIQDVQSKFPAFAALLDKSVASLSKFMGLAFPLSGRAIEELKRRVRAALKDVKAWESGPCSILAFEDKMRFVKLVLDSNCDGWTPKKDPTVQELLDVLIARLGSFKDSIRQAKRKETLLAWRAEVKAHRVPVRPKDKKDVTVVASTTAVTSTASHESGLAASSRVALNVLQSATPSANGASAPAAHKKPRVTANNSSGSGGSSASVASAVGAAASTSVVTAAEATTEPSMATPDALRALVVPVSANTSKKEKKRWSKKKKAMAKKKAMPITGAKKRK